VENQETLKTRAVVGDTADFVQDLVDKLLADGVMTTRIVVGGVLFAGNHLLGVEEVLVCASADFVDDIGLEIAVDGTWDVFAVASNRYQHYQFEQSGGGR